LQIDMTSTEAETLVAAAYLGDSKPMSKNTNLRNTQSLDWWRSNDKNETFTQARKQAAVQCYLHIAGRSREDIPLGAFPAAFLFSDGERRRPDKGLIKVLLQSHMITGRQHNGELIFELTERGRTQFLGQGA
jgi:hypothetical protein